MKPSIRARKLMEDRQRRQAAKEEYWRRAEEHRMEEEYYMNRFGGRGMPPFGESMAVVQSVVKCLYLIVMWK